MTVQESNKELQGENTDGMTPAEASLATSWGIGQTLSSEGSNTNKSIKESTPAIEGYYEIPASLRMRLNDDGSLKQTESKPDDSSVEPELPEVSNDTPSRPKQEANSPFTLDLGSLDDLINEENQKLQERLKTSFQEPETTGIGTELGEDNGASGPAFNPDTWTFGNEPTLDEIITRLDENHIWDLDLSGLPPLVLPDEQPEGTSERVDAGLIIDWDAIDDRISQVDQTFAPSETVPTQNSDLKDPYAEDQNEAQAIADYIESMDPFYTDYIRSGNDDEVAITLAGTPHYRAVATNIPLRQLIQQTIKSRYEMRQEAEEQTNTNEDISPFATEHLVQDGIAPLNPYMEGALAELPIVEVEPDTTADDVVSKIRLENGLVQDTISTAPPTEDTRTLKTRATQIVQTILGAVNGVLETRVTVDNSGKVVSKDELRAEEQAVTIDAKNEQIGIQVIKKIKDSGSSMVQWIKDATRDRSMDDWTDDEKRQYVKTLTRELDRNIGTFVGVLALRTIIGLVDPALVEPFDTTLRSTPTILKATVFGLTLLKTSSEFQPYLSSSEASPTEKRIAKVMRPLAKAGHVTSRITGPISNLARYATSGAAGLFIGEQFDHAILSIEHLTGSHAVTTATEIPTTVVVSHPTSEGVVHPIAAVETHTALPTVTHDHPHNPLLGNVDVDHGKQTVVPTTTSTETPVPSPTHEPTPTIRPTLVQATATVVAPTPEAHVTIPVPHSSDADDRINQQPVAGGTVPVVPAPLAPQQPDNHPSQFHYDSTPLHGQTTANGDKYFGGYGNPAHLAMVQKAGTTEQIPLHVDKEYEEQINRALAAEGKVAHFHTAALNNTLNDATHRYTENHGFTDDFKHAHDQAERNILNAESRMILSGNDVKHFSDAQLIHDAETLGIVTDVHGANQASTPLDTSRFDHQVTPIGKLNGTYLEPHHDLTTTREQHTLIMHQEVTGAEKLAQLMTEEGTHGYTIDKSHYEARLQQALHIQTGEGFASIIKRDPQHAQEYRDLQQLYLFSDDAKSVRDHLNNHTTIEAAQRLGVLAHVPAGFGYHYGTHGNDGVATPLTHLSFDGGIAKGNPFDVHNPLEIIYSDGHTQAWHPEVVGTGNIFNLLTRSKLEGYQINTTNLMYYFNLAANYREQGILTEKEHADFVHIWNLCTSQRQLDATHAKMLLDILQKLQVINPKNN